ncbi:MAG: hypothetical protein LLG24_02795 [Actinomycetia bacterium]|nr:hypothetical protein [Actinomycetes bacterium]
MQDKRASKAFMLRVIGVAVGVAAIVGLLFVVNAEEGFEDCTGTGEFGWLVPLIAALVIGGLAWVLLSQEPHHDDHHEGSASDAVCPACGCAVLSQWRMCPYCGQMLSGDAGACEATSVES